MNSLLCLLIIASVCQTGMCKNFFQTNNDNSINFFCSILCDSITMYLVYFSGFALKCWNCPMDANPTKPCLQADPNVNATGFKVETCTGKDPACTKTSASKLELREDLDGNID